MEKSKNNMAAVQRALAAEGQKFCSRCYRIRRKNEFGRATSRPDGLTLYCKECISAYQAEYYSRHQETIKARNCKTQTERREARKRGEAPPPIPRGRRLTALDVVIAGVVLTKPIEQAFGQTRSEMLASLMQAKKPMERK